MSDSEELQSYKDIYPTTSKNKILNTKEFREKQLELLDLNEKEIIDSDELDFRLNEYLEEIKKYMIKKLKKSKGKIEKKIKEIEKISIKHKSTLLSKIDDLNESDKYKFEFNNIYINMPKVEYMKNEVNKIIKYSSISDIENYNVNAYVSLEIIGHSLFRTHIKKLNIYYKSKEELQNEIEENLIEVIKRVPSYEDNTYSLYNNNIAITVSISNWESIENWGDRYICNKLTKFKKYKDFTLFIAPGKDNCVKQCVEFLNGTWDENKTFQEMIPQHKIITYTPLGELQNVENMNDLISDNDEDAKTNDCINIARVLKYNGHMGIITKINRYKARSKIQSNNRLDNKEDDSKEIYMDIEAFTKEIDSKNKRQIPYLLCWCDNNNNIDKTIGKKCIEKFISKLLKNNLGNNVTLYAWYGSGYDFQHIISCLKDKNGECKIIIRNSSIIYGEIYFPLFNTKIILKDPYLFLLTSLDKAAKAFNVLNKGSFPHSIIKDWDDLNKILPNWITIQRKTIEYKNDNKIGFIVKRQENIIKEEDVNYKSIIEKAIEYCTVDVLAMKEVWQKFKILMKNNLDLKISKHMFTLSQMSMSLMESCLEKHVKMLVPTKELYPFIRDSMYGGRVLAKNGIYNEEIIYADVVSLYPSAMKLLDHPFGNYEYVNEINLNKLGIYKVKLTHTYDKEPENYLNFVPRKLGGRLSWNWFKEHIGNYTTYDLKIAIDEGYKITLIEGIEYKEKGGIFNKFIDKLYQLKEEHSSCSCEEKPCPIRLIAKIALNGGGYGKFVQRPIDKDVYIVKRDIVAGVCDSLKADKENKVMLGGVKVNRPIFYNLDGKNYDKMVIKKDEDPSYATQQGVFILSGSRYRLYKLCKKFKGIKIIYSDTDSIFILKSSINEDEFRKSCNKNLGSLDDEIEGSKDNTIKEMIIGGPKMYGYIYETPKGEEKINLYCKGVPKDMLSYDQIYYMVEKDKSIAYHFEILKRKLINIDSMNIIKNVKQTIAYKGENYTMNKLEEIYNEITC
uniref:DNA polymerase n=1 Tax=Pichia etchellsii TaxID=28550 RepID=Q9C130_PICET|nr:putative terminal protein / DNA-polymerase [Schwanniomyces etchellsii]